jgi:hypothetical protein
MPPATPWRAVESIRVPCSLLWAIIANTVVYTAGRRQTHPQYLREMSVQDGSQRRVDLVLGSVILAILSSPAIVIVGWMIVQSRLRGDLND